MLNLSPTLALAGLFAVLTVFCGWRGARKARPHTHPRMIPWRLLMLVAFTGVVAMLVHVVTLVRDPGGLGTP